jgi:hypothetical protein
MVVLEGTEPGSPDGDAEGSNNASTKRSFVPIVVEEDMSAIQRKRFNYFKQMRTFLTNVTNICERLRCVILHVK